MGSDFSAGVKEIVIKDNRRIRIVSKEDTEIEIPCRLDFIAS